MQAGVLIHSMTFLQPPNQGQQSNDEATIVGVGKMGNSERKLIEKTREVSFELIPNNILYYKYLNLLRNLCILTWN